MIFSLFLKILENMAFIWQIHLYAKKYGKIQKIWHLPYIYGIPGTLALILGANKLAILNITLQDWTLEAKGY
jgi:hypothetical protein